MKKPIQTMMPVAMIIALLTTVQSKGAAEPITLDPAIISFIDGKSYGLHGGLVGAMLKMARDMQTMQLGKRTEKGVRVGTYTFEGEQHCIRSLVAIEEACNQAIAEETASDMALIKQYKKRLEEMLATTKYDFQVIFSPFLAQAHGAKEPMFLLIAESCRKRNRPNSLLLTWAKNSEEEMKSFSRTVTSFALFDDFCTDLINFLEDLLRSCPKARAQFEQLKEEYLRKQAAKA